MRPSCAERALRTILAAGLVAVLGAATAAAQDTAPPIRVATLPGGVTLHYVEAGHGDPVVFVHGSLSFGGYWSDEVGYFAASHRVVAYSRRYNFPNHNSIRPGYSAIVDAEDLAALIGELGLGRVHVVGHSYGALTALFLAARHPELVRSLVLAEPPAVSLLGHLSRHPALGRATLADIREHMLAPMTEAFKRGDREAGIAAFMSYVFRDPQAWQKLPEPARQDALRNAGEWDAMLTSGELFPTLEPSAVRAIHAPVLLLSGELSYPFLGLIDEELLHLLPDARRVVVPQAGHQMWIEQPQVCRDAVRELWRRVDAERP